MAVFLKALPQTPGRGADRAGRGQCAGVAERGAKLYEQHCAQCHGEQGEGVRGRLSAAGRQPRRDHAGDRQPGAGRAERRLSAGHAPATRGPSACRPYATRAQRRRRGRGAQPHPRVLGQPRRAGERAGGEPATRRLAACASGSVQNRGHGTSTRRPARRRCPARSGWGPCPGASRPGAPSRRRRGARGLALVVCLTPRSELAELSPDYHAARGARPAAVPLDAPADAQFRRAGRPGRLPARRAADRAGAARRATP